MTYALRIFLLKLQTAQEWFLHPYILLSNHLRCFLSLLWRCLLLLFCIARNSPLTDNIRIAFFLPKLYNIVIICILADYYIRTLPSIISGTYTSPFVVLYNNSPAFSSRSRQSRNRKKLLLPLCLFLSVSSPHFPSPKILYNSPVFGV